jgi:soluble cytochrome b562
LSVLIFLEGETMSDEQQTQQADDPSGPGWRDVIAGEILQPGDMMPTSDIKWQETRGVGKPALSGLWYRRRIEQSQQPSDSEPETMEQLRRRLAECEVLLAEAERGGQQVSAELQQLREQVQTLTQERDRYQSWLQQHHTTGQQSAIKKLERWLKPVVKVVADHPDHTSILAASVLEFLPQIASRLIEE